MQCHTSIYLPREDQELLGIFLCVNYGMGHDYFIQSCRINMILIYFRTGPLQVAIKAKTNVTRGHHPNHTTVPGPINSQHTHL